MSGRSRIIWVAGNCCACQLSATTTLVAWIRRASLGKGGWSKPRADLVGREDYMSFGTIGQRGVTQGVATEAPHACLRAVLRCAVVLEPIEVVRTDLQ